MARIRSAEATWLRRRMRFNLSTCQTWKKLWVKLEKMVFKCFLDVLSSPAEWHLSQMNHGSSMIINDHQWSWCMSWCLRTVIHHPFRLETFMKEVGWWILQMSLTSEPGIPGGSGRGRLRCKAKDCWGEGWKMDEHGYRCLQYFALMLVEMDR